VIGRRLAILASTAALVCAVGAATNATATTGPSPYTVVQVRLSDGKIVLNKLHVSHVTFVDFLVRNTGKQTHNFSIGGYSTHPLATGQTQHLYVGFPVSGKYKYSVTLHATPGMAGWFRITEPEQPD
jgi:plastocyanin